MRHSSAGLPERLFGHRNWRSVLVRFIMADSCEVPPDRRPAPVGQPVTLPHWF
jgi:hypothetical protein